MTPYDILLQARAHMKALQAQKVAEQVVRTMLEEAQEELAELRKEVRADCVLTSCRLRADCALDDPPS
jgi:hypothetical protein